MDKLSYVHSFEVHISLNGKTFLLVFSRLKNEGLPGVLENKGTLAKYRREQGNISQFVGTREQNSKNYSTKTFGKCMGTWEHRAILEGNKGTKTPLGDPQKSVIRDLIYASNVTKFHMVITRRVYVSSNRKWVS